MSPFGPWDSREFEDSEEDADPIVSNVALVDKIVLQDLAKQAGCC